MNTAQFLTLQIIIEVESNSRKDTYLVCACLWVDFSFDEVINVRLQVASQGSTVQCLCSLPTSKSVQEVLVKEVHVTSTHAQTEENAHQAADCSVKVTAKVK